MPTDRNSCDSVTCFSPKVTSVTTARASLSLSLSDDAITGSNVTRCYVRRTVVLSVATEEVSAENKTLSFQDRTQDILGKRASWQNVISFKSYKWGSVCTDVPKITYKAELNGFGGRSLPQASLIGDRIRGIQNWLGNQFRCYPIIT
jgi:hypothetical protein